MAEIAEPEVTEEVSDETREDFPWNVVVFNDDTTPINVVEEIFIQVLKKTPEKAKSLTMEIHTTGRGLAFSGSMKEALEKKEKLDNLGLTTEVQI